MHSARRTRGRHVTAAVLGWLATAIGAVAVGLIAVSFLGRGLTDSGQQPLSGSAVRQALGETGDRAGPTADGDNTVRPREPERTADASPEASPGRSPEPEPSRSPRDPATNKAGGDNGGPRGLETVGGTVIVRCVDGEPDILSWTPKPGYEAEEDNRGSGSGQGVRFEPEDGREAPRVRLRVTCDGDRPVPHVRLD